MGTPISLVRLWTESIEIRGPVINLLPILSISQTMTHDRADKLRETGVDEAPRYEDGRSFTNQVSHGRRLLTRAS